MRSLGCCFIVFFCTPYLPDWNILLCNQKENFILNKRNLKTNCADFVAAVAASVFLLLILLCQIFGVDCHIFVSSCGIVVATWLSLRATLHTIASADVNCFIFARRKSRPSWHCRLALFICCVVPAAESTVVLTAFRRRTHHHGRPSSRSSIGGTIGRIRGCLLGCCVYFLVSLFW